MCRRSFCLISLVLLLGLVSSTSAATSWTNGTGNQRWDDPGNWDAGVPDAYDRAYISMTGADSAVIGASVGAEANRIYIGRTADGCLKVTGGTLTVTDRIYTGYGGNNGTIDISNGTITVTNKILIGSTGNGTINMTGGVIRTKDVDIPGDVTGSGHLQLDDGLFICDGIFTLSAGGTCDITGGTLILAGEITSLPGISGYGVPDGVNFDYDPNANMTTITAIPGLSPIAHQPSPSNGTTNVSLNVVLSWYPGRYAAAHDVYFGTDWDDVNDANHASEAFKGRQDANSYNAGALESLMLGETYYWRVDEVNEPNIWKGDVWGFTTDTGKAIDPTPRDGATDVVLLTDALLWTPSPYAVLQDVYFGTSFEDVNTRTTPDISGLGGDVKQCDIPEPYLPLKRGQTYFWRVDTDNSDALPSTKGDVWSFTLTVQIVFYDDFNMPHDYVSGSVGGTGWDGFLGLGEGETVDALEADMNNPGQLYIQSTGGQWDPGFDGIGGMAVGPFLYKEVLGNFTATVKVTDYPALFDPNHVNTVLHNNCGIMARVGNLDMAGAGEDWVSMDYFPIWDRGNYLRHCNNGARSELCHNSSGWDADLYLQLERAGNNFHARHSPDGETWTELECSPVTRNDLDGIEVQVGLMHATYNLVTGYAAFDDFILIRKPWPQARGPRPPDGATNVRINTKLGWRSGDFVQDVNGHQVYFGTDFNNVNDANTTSHMNVDLYVVSDPCVDPGLLEFGTEYFWRVDEVDGTDLWRGNIWRFTTAEWVVVDDFELYSTRDDLRIPWKDGYASYPGVTSASNITISTESDPRLLYWPPPGGPIEEGADAMQFVYDNDGLVTLYVPDEWLFYYYAPYYSEIEANISDLPALSDWTTHGVKALALSFFGTPDNDANEQMYVVVEDGTGAEAIAKYGDDINEDMNNIRKPKWQQWNIDLTEFSDGGVDLNDVNKVYIGFGNRETPEAGGSGIVYFDSIRLYRPRCLPGTVTGDFDGDCKINRKDLAKMVAGWLGGEPSAPLVHLDAGDLSEGPVTTWVNAGTLGGKFDVNSLDPDDNPTRGTVNSRAAVIFDGNDYLIADFNAPGGITGANDFTVAIWAHNPQVANEECMVNWAKRGTSRRCAQLNYGLAPSSGAVTHWGVADMGYDGGVPEASMWHHIAVTYEGGENGTEIVWVDGKLNAIEHKTLNLWPDCPIYLGTAVQSDLITLVLHFSGSLAGVQVYDYALPEHEIVYLATGSFPADLNGDGKVNFKDLAILANRWLEGPILWP